MEEKRLDFRIETKNVTYSLEVEFQGNKLPITVIETTRPGGLLINEVILSATVLGKNVFLKRKYTGQHYLPELIERILHVFISLYL